MPLLRRALGLLQLAAATPPVRLGEPCSNTPTPAPAMPTPADPLAQLLAAVLAYRPQPWAWACPFSPLLAALLAPDPSKRPVLLMPRPPYLPHPLRRLARLPGVVVIRAAQA